MLNNNGKYSFMTKRSLLQVGAFAASIALMSAGAMAQDVLHGQVQPDSVQAGPNCGKVTIIGAPVPLYAFDKSRTDIQNIIFHRLDSGTDLYYQVGGSLVCSDGGQALQQIIWVN